MFHAAQISSALAERIVYKCSTNVFDHCDFHRLGMSGIIAEKFSIASNT